MKMRPPRYRDGTAGRCPVGFGLFKDSALKQTAEDAFGADRSAYSKRAFAKLLRKPGCEARHARRAVVFLRVDGEELTFRSVVEGLHEEDRPQLGVLRKRGDGRVFAGAAADLCTSSEQLLKLCPLQG